MSNSLNGEGWKLIRPTKEIESEENKRVEEAIDLIREVVTEVTSESNLEKIMNRLQFKESKNEEQIELSFHKYFLEHKGQKYDICIDLKLKMKYERPWKPIGRDNNY